jgi:predicted site-specific integrase-resolvase
MNLNVDRHLTIRQAAEIVNRPVPTLRHWRRHGRGPRGFISEGRLMYAESELRRWMDEQVHYADNVPGEAVGL